MITLSADDFSNVFGAGNGNAFGHVHALFPGLVVIQRIFIVIQTEQRELVQGDLQGSLVIQRVPLSAAPLHVGEQRTRHLGWVWKQRGKTYRRRVGLSWERQVLKKAPLVRIQCASLLLVSKQVIIINQCNPEAWNTRYSQRLESRQWRYSPLECAPLPCSSFLFAV